ncbi:hypothetical protein K503DRAFT_318690 [Rhizopogon vinicolor AM-OR11-026]|uniref:Extracellular membrane protein CFEM domain-containing protein n=1 Tax=Rhizopogon vinicolor AM-OR11-026 TaxID=1314800 RepID=A0A1B7MUF5_9AGAM|nr:hypothetical protein K503DRAFT_318690 [Rhizopogon vinicolor AM-OR11-026]
MRTSTICFTVLLATATLVSARPSTSHLAHTFRMLSGVPYKRQSSTPSQCTSTCDVVSSELNAGCSPTACCTQSFETSYYDCLLCVGTADNATDYSQAQTDLDELYTSCYDQGYTLQELTLPGQNPSRTLSTSSPVTTSLVTATSSSIGVITSLLKTTISTIPSSTINPSGTANGSSTTTSSTSTSTGAALGVNSGKRKIWALAAAAAGLIMI